jgi:hypothetical protein
MPTALPEVTAWSTGATWPIDGEPATIESVASQVQELKNRSNYLKSKTDLVGYNIPGSGIRSEAQDVSYSTAGSITNLTDTSTAPVLITGGIELFEHDVVFGEVFFEVVLASAASVALYATCACDGVSEKTNERFASCPTLSGGVDVLNLVIPVHFPIFYQMPADGTFGLSMHVLLTGTATVRNLFVDNTDWAHLQIWRPVV